MRNLAALLSFSLSLAVIVDARAAGPSDGDKVCRIYKGDQFLGQIYEVSAAPKAAYKVGYKDKSAPEDYGDISLIPTPTQLTLDRIFQDGNDIEKQELIGDFNLLTWQLLPGAPGSGKVQDTSISPYGDYYRKLVIKSEALNVPFVQMVFPKGSETGDGKFKIEFLGGDKEAFEKKQYKLKIMGIGSDPYQLQGNLCRKLASLDGLPLTSTILVDPINPRFESAIIRVISKADDQFKNGAGNIEYFPKDGAPGATVGGIANVDPRAVSDQGKTGSEAPAGYAIQGSVSTHAEGAI